MASPKQSTDNKLSTGESDTVLNIFTPILHYFGRTFCQAATFGFESFDSRQGIYVINKRLNLIGFQTRPPHVSLIIKTTGDNILGATEQLNLPRSGTPRDYFTHFSH